MYQPVVAELFYTAYKLTVKKQNIVYFQYISKKRIIKWLLVPVNLFSLWPQCYCTCNDDAGRSNVAVLWEICRHILPHVLMAIARAIIRTNIWMRLIFFSFFLSFSWILIKEEVGVEFTKHNGGLFLVLMKFIHSFLLKVLQKFLEKCTLNLYRLGHNVPYVE